MKKPVLTKKDFVRRYAAGEFGNASPTWNSLEEMEEDESGLAHKLLQDDTQLWHIRNRVAGGPTWYDVPGVELPDQWYDRCNQVGKGNLYISAMAPTSKTILQGEVTRHPQYGLTLRYTCEALPMRQALEVSSANVTGMLARLLLACLCDNSYGWLMELLDNYPDHVVEFSTYATNWGTVPGYNTVFWEVRNY